MGITSVFAKNPHVEDALVRHYAELMNVSDTMLHIPELYLAIHEWIGTPYKYGRSDKTGTDCSGFVRNIVHPLSGKELPRSSSDMSKIIVAKPKSELREGDLVFFNYRSSNSHVGIYLQNGWFVHASTVRGVTLNNLYTPWYTKRFSKGGSLKQGELKEFILQSRQNSEAAIVPSGLEPLAPIDVTHVRHPAADFCILSMPRP